MTGQIIQLRPMTDSVGAMPCGPRSRASHRALLRGLGLSASIAIACRSASFGRAFGLMSPARRFKSYHSNHPRKPTFGERLVWYFADHGDLCVGIVIGFAMASILLCMGAYFIRWAL